MLNFTEYTVSATSILIDSNKNLNVSYIQISQVNCNLEEPIFKGFHIIRSKTYFLHCRNAKSHNVLQYMLSIFI